MPIDADIFISLIRNWSKVRPFVAGCIDQQSRFRRLFTAGDGNVDAEFLAERKRPRQTTYRDYWSGHAINCSGIKPAGSGINSCKTGQSNVDFTNINRVSELLSVPTKDASRDSFPGDHGMMLLIFRHSCGVISAKLLALSPLLFCGFCVSQSNDWRTLVY